MKLIKAIFLMLRVYSRIIPCWSIKMVQIMPIFGVRSQFQFQKVDIMTIVAFIPARSGSKRLPNKNIKSFCGHPLLAYTVRAAVDSCVFDSVICATDSKLYADIAKYYGAEVPFLRPGKISTDKSPDIEWVTWMLKALKDKGCT